MSQNEALYLLRKDKGIGLKEAARGSHVPFLLLYLYERGYLRLRAKDERLLTSFYGVETSYFKDRAGYPTPIFTKTGPSKFMSALYTFGATWRAFAVSTILFVSCLGLVASGGAIAYKTNNKASSYYDADYLSLVGNVIEKGDPVLFVEEVRSIEYDKDDENTISLMVTTLQRQVGDLTYTVHLVSDSANYEIQFKETTSALSLDFARSESGTYLSQGKANLTAGKYLISELKDGTGGAVEESVWASEQAKLDSCPSLVNGLFEGLRSDRALTTARSLDELLLLQGQGNEKLSADVSLGDNLLLLPSLFAALFFCLSALIVWGLIHKRRHAEVPVAYVEAPEKTLEPIIRSRPSAYRDLRGNWSFGPFIPETLLRLGAIAIVLASSIMLFHLCHTVLASGDLMAIASLIGDAEKWYKFMPLVSMACLLWFFVRLEIMPSERYNLLPAIIMFFFGGCVYYVAENMLAFYLSDTGNYYYNLLFIGLTYILPGNLFWGIGCFALIDLFLLTTPLSSQTKRGRLFGGAWPFCRLCTFSFPISIRSARAFGAGPNGRAISLTFSTGNSSRRWSSPSSSRSPFTSAASWPYAVSAWRKQPSISMAMSTSSSKTSSPLSGLPSSWS